MNVDKNIFPLLGFLSKLKFKSYFNEKATSKIFFLLFMYLLISLNIYLTSVVLEYFIETNKISINRLYVYIYLFSTGYIVLFRLIPKVRILTNIFPANIICSTRTKFIINLYFELNKNYFISLLFIQFFILLIVKRLDLLFFAVLFLNNISTVIIDNLLKGIFLFQVSNKLFLRLLIFALFGFAFVYFPFNNYGLVLLLFSLFLMLFLIYTVAKEEISSNIDIDNKESENSAGILSIISSQPFKNKKTKSVLLVGFIIKLFLFCILCLQQYFVKKEIFPVYIYPLLLSPIIFFNYIFNNTWVFFSNYFTCIMLYNINKNYFKLYLLVTLKVILYDAITTILFIIVLQLNFITYSVYYITTILLLLNLGYFISCFAPVKSKSNNSFTHSSANTSSLGNIISIILLIGNYFVIINNLFFALLSFIINLLFFVYSYKNKGFINQQNMKKIKNEMFCT